MQAILRRFDPADHEKLLEMYAEFEPKEEFQGLPPGSLPQIELWLRQVQEKKFAQFVVEDDGRIAGHAVLCQSQRGVDAELAIFLHQRYRRLGLGRRLLHCVLNHGRKVLKLDRVWIMVQGNNPAAVRLFQSVGFHSTGQSDPMAYEWEMQCLLHGKEPADSEFAVAEESLPITIEIPDMKQRS